MNNCGIIETYYDSGELKEKYFQNNNLKEGIYQKFYKSGQIIIEVNYNK